MKKGFYSQLAGTNIKKNGKIYFPYILTCIVSIMMLYQICYMLECISNAKMPGAYSIAELLSFGIIVVSIFSVVVLFYTNSFLMKQRKKELGLFNILGMEKKHIAKVLSIESIYVFVISIVSGLFVGVLFSKLLMALLMKLLKFEIPFTFYISWDSVLKTLIIFSASFFVSLLYNLGQVQLSKPIELLHGGNVGEKEPKTKLILTIIGVITLGTGYYIAITTENPMSALMLFFIAVILVIIGTYCLFTAGSIALLKALRKNKNYYYKTKHFVSVSGMMYRMKQNAVGLANICILSTMVLVMISVTTCLYFGLEDSLRNSFPRNVGVELEDTTKQENQLVNNKIDKILKKHKVTPKDTLSYRSFETAMNKEENKFFVKSDTSFTNSVAVIFISLDEYNKIQNTNVTLKDNEVMVYSPDIGFENKTVKFGDSEFKVIKNLESLNVNYISNFESHYFILKNEDAILNAYNNAYNNKTNGIHGFSYYYGFDLEDKDAQIKITDEISKEIGKTDINGRANCVEANRQDFLGLFGGLFFLGIFLAVLFLVATVLIMYYKQISEGYEDKGRFEIMQKVGMDKKEIKSTIRSQVLTVFFLPLAAAAIHLAAAFKMITRMLLVFGMTNTGLFALCTVITVLVFAIFYGVVYSATAKAYYRIVE